MQKGRYTDMKAFVTAAMSPEGQKIGGSIYFDFAPISNATADRVQEAVGLDIHGYGHALDGSGVVHILKGHGEGGSRLKQFPNQIPLTVEDLKMLPDVVEYADSVEPSETSNRVFFKKRVDGHIIVLEATYKRHHKLVPITAWKEIVKK